MKGVLITSGVGPPVRRDIEVDEQLKYGEYYHETGKEKDMLYHRAYVYAPEHADKAFELFSRQYNEEQALRSKFAKEWNQLSDWRLRLK